MNNEQLHHDIGGLKSEVQGLRREVDAITDKLDQVLARQYRFAGATGSVSALAAFAAAWFTK